MNSGRVVVLTGGVGGAKLLRGLVEVIAPAQITAVVNTGDDFRHLGLWISPDLDTVLYTLAGKASRERGWGREGETWNFMEALRSLEGEAWFQLGDADLALHILRTSHLAKGSTLTQVSRQFAHAWDVGVDILPMSDDAVSTCLTTDEGDLPFQRYFVERRCVPRVSAVRFEGAAIAKAAPGVVEAIGDSSTRAVLIAPSNPFLSIDPILAVPALRSALKATAAPVIAISPIIDGRAVKGPTAKIMAELGLAVTPAAIADHYQGVIDGMLIDSRDASDGLGVPSASTDTLMSSLEDRARVASAALALADHLARELNK